MEKNIFEDLHSKKQKMAAFLSKAEEFGWIKNEEKAEYLSKIERDVLTIGVIGQMKAGKSTFLNAFVFEDDVLPAATTPMTAALSVITYGPEKKVTAEFYNKEEWEEQKMTAQMSLDGTSDEIMKSKIKAAQELVEKSSKLNGNLDSLLGTIQEDSFDNLEEYVGADGKYVSITKSVTIYYPKEYLKGVNIVDTPGFNDPIVSREERTKEFLKKADVVLLMLYAGRPFDATDRAILFKNVGECGIGKVLIGINKYDIPYENGETEEEICKYVKTEISKASRLMGDEQLNDVLRDTDPIPLSAEMALLSEIEMSKISKEEKFSHAWKRACDCFEISSQSEMRVKSHIIDLIAAIRQVIEKEKETILFKKPLNTILARGNAFNAEINENIVLTSNEIEILQAPDDDLEEMENNLSRVSKRLNKKIDGLGGDIDQTFDNIIRKGEHELEDSVDACCRKMNSIVDAWGLMETEEKLRGALVREIDFFVSRTLKRQCKDIMKNAKHKLKETLDNFFCDAEDVLSRLSISGDFDQRDFVKNVSGKFNFDNDDRLFTISDDEGNEEEDFFDHVFGVANAFFNGLTFGVGGVLVRALNHDSIVNEMKNEISNIQNSFDANEYLNTLVSSKDNIINEVKKAFNEEFLTPLQEKLDEVRTQGVNKERKLEEAKQRLEKLKDRNSEIMQQMEVINSMK